MKSLEIFIVIMILIIIFMLSISGCVGCGARVKHPGHPFSGVRCFPTFVKDVYGFISYSSGVLKKNGSANKHDSLTKVDSPWYLYILRPIAYTVMTTVIVIDLPTELIFDALLLPLDISLKQKDKLSCH